MFRKINREAGSVSNSEINIWINEKWKQIKNDFSEDNIFNIDETGIFYDLLPDKTLRRETYTKENY